MTRQQPIELVSQLKRLGFAQGNHMKLYGEKLQMVSDPIVVRDDEVLVDAVEEKSGKTRRVAIPLPILKMKKNLAA